MVIKIIFGVITGSYSLKFQLISDKFVKIYDFNAIMTILLKKFIKK